MGKLDWPRIALYAASAALAIWVVNRAFTVLAQ